MALVPVLFKLCLLNQNGNDNVITHDMIPEKEDNMSAAASKRHSLNIRIKPEERDLIDRAAQARGKNRTDFILDAARRAAEDALLDRTIFVVSPEAYAEFLTRLDAPAQPNRRLKQTMLMAAPWDNA